MKIRLAPHLVPSLDPAILSRHLRRQVADRFYPNGSLPKVNRYGGSAAARPTALSGSR